MREQIQGWVFEHVISPFREEPHLDLHKQGGGVL